MKIWPYVKSDPIFRFHGFSAYFKQPGLTKNIFKNLNQHTLIV